MNERQPGALDRILRPFADVRGGEGNTALLLAVNVFVLLCAYSIMKVLREPLIAASGDASLKSYASAGQALLLLLVVPAYGMLAARVPRRRLIVTVTSIFLVCIGSFYVLGKLDAHIGFAFYVWLGVFNVMIVAQFWAFANDVYTTEEGKRLFPIVAFGATSGAVVGAWLPGQLRGPLGLLQLMLVSAALLVLSLWITLVVDASERRRTEQRAPSPLQSGTLPAATAQFRHETGEFRAVLESDTYAKASGQFKTVKPGSAPADDVKATKSAFALVFSNPYLLALAVMMFILNWVNSNGEFMLTGAIRGMAADAVANGTAGGLTTGELISDYYSSFQTIVNLAAMLVQLFLVSRVIKYIGPRAALLFMPLIAMGGYAIYAIMPVLAALRWAKTTENATDYSLNKTTVNVMFLPMTREEKYSGKQAIDGFFVRFGDVASAGLVYAGSHWIMMQSRHFAMVNVALAAVWLALAVMIGRRYERLAAATTA